MPLSAQELVYTRLTGDGRSERTLLVATETLRQELLAGNVTFDGYAAQRAALTETFEREVAERRRAQINWGELPKGPPSHPHRGAVYVDVARNEYVLFNGADWVRYPKERLA